jgi:hypothetical protein
MNIVRFTLPLVLAGFIVGWLNLVRFGSPWESGYGNEAHQFFPFQLWRTIPLLLASFDKGLFLYCPILLLGLFGWKKFFSKFKSEALLIGGVLLTNLILTGAWHSWEGGWGWGPRLLVPTVPLWLIPAAFSLTSLKAHSRFLVFVALTAISFAVQIPGVLVKGQEVRVIKEMLLTAEERASAPSDLRTILILLQHKLAGRNEIYKTLDFNIPGSRDLDLTEYDSFVGLNVWSEHVARRMNKPSIRWFPTAGLVLILFLMLRIKTLLKNTAVRPRT